MLGERKGARKDMYPNIYPCSLHRGQNSPPSLLRIFIMLASFRRLSLLALLAAASSSYASHHDADVDTQANATDALAEEDINATVNATSSPTITEPSPDDEGIQFEHFTAFSSSQTCASDKHGELKC